MEQLKGLHAALTKYLMARLQSGMQETGMTAEELATVKNPLSAAEVGNIITFLKNNNITADMSKDTALKALKDAIERNKAPDRSTLSDSIDAYPGVH